MKASAGSAESSRTGRPVRDDHPGAPPRRAGGAGESGGDVVPDAEAPMRWRSSRAGARWSAGSRCAPRLASRTRWRARPRAIGIDVGADLVDRLRSSGPTSPSSPSTAGRRGRDRPGAARDPRPPLHRSGGGRLRSLHGQGRRQARDPSRRDPHPGLGRVQRHRLPRAGGGCTLDEIEARLGFPLVVKPAAGLLARGRVRLPPG